jgi:hypothetical protein
MGIRTTPFFMTPFTALDEPITLVFKEFHRLLPGRHGEQGVCKMTLPNDARRNVFWTEVESALLPKYALKRKQPFTR